jgi:hypothetical protein
LSLPDPVDGWQPVNLLPTSSAVDAVNLLRGLIR